MTHHKISYELSLLQKLRKTALSKHFLSLPPTNLKLLWVDLYRDDGR
jgi:hypothetical protein